jgi:hypothetical protein
MIIKAQPVSATFLSTWLMITASLVERLIDSQHLKYQLNSWPLNAMPQIKQRSRRRLNKLLRLLLIVLLRSELWQSKPPQNKQPPHKPQPPQKLSVSQPLKNWPQGLKLKELQLNKLQQLKRLPRDSKPN